MTPKRDPAKKRSKKKSPASKKQASKRQERLVMDRLAQPDWEVIVGQLKASRHACDACGIAVAAGTGEVIHSGYQNLGAESELDLWLLCDFCSAMVQKRIGYKEKRCSITDRPRIVREWLRKVDKRDTWAEDIPPHLRSGQPRPPGLIASSPSSPVVKHEPTRQSSPKAKYRNEYLRSAAWDERSRVFLRQHPRCACCGATPVSKKFVTHHLSYDNKDDDHPGQEPDEDLMALCWDCHVDVHAFWDQCRRDKAIDNLRAATHAWIAIRNGDQRDLAGLTDVPGTVLAREVAPAKTLTRPTC